HNIVRIYYLCIHTTRKENLQALELEIDNVLQQIRKNFETYELDTFYQSIRFIVDFLYFQYYSKTGNQVRAEHHYELIQTRIPDIAVKPMFSFHISQFLEAKLERFMATRDLQALCSLNEHLENGFDSGAED